MSTWGSNSAQNETNGSGWHILQDEDYSELAAQVHKRLLQELDVAAVSRLDHDSARAAVEAAARGILTTTAPELLGEQREQVIRRVVDEAVDLGPLEPLLRDNTISEVMVNAPDEVYYERDGVITESKIHFQDADHILRIVDRILAPRGS